MDLVNSNDQKLSYNQVLLGSLVNMKEMGRSHNTTLAHRFRDMGYPELIKLLEE